MQKYYFGGSCTQASLQPSSCPQFLPCQAAFHWELSIGILYWFMFIPFNCFLSFPEKGSDKTSPNLPKESCCISIKKKRC